MSLLFELGFLVYFLSRQVEARLLSLSLQCVFDFHKRGHFAFLLKILNGNRKNTLL